MTVPGLSVDKEYANRNRTPVISFDSLLPDLFDLERLARFFFMKFTT